MSVTVVKSLMTCEALSFMLDIPEGMIIDNIERVPSKHEGGKPSFMMTIYVDESVEHLIPTGASRVSFVYEDNYEEPSYYLARIEGVA